MSLPSVKITVAVATNIAHLFIFMKAIAKPLPRDIFQNIPPFNPFKIFLDNHY